MRTRVYRFTEQDIGKTELVVRFDNDVAILTLPSPVPVTMVGSWAHFDENGRLMDSAIRIPSRVLA